MPMQETEVVDEHGLLSNKHAKPTAPVVIAKQEADSTMPAHISPTAAKAYLGLFTPLLL